MSVLLNHVRRSVGKYYLIIENRDEIVIICSPASPGVFYINTGSSIIISNNEVEVYSHSSPAKLNDMEVLNMLVSHPAYRSPFSSIFKNVDRITGGMILHIKRDFNIRKELFLEDECLLNRRNHRFDKNKYITFKQTLEKTIELIADGQKNNPKYILLSGGIDSSVLLLGLQKFYDNIQAVHWPMKKRESLVVHELCKKSGVKLNYLNLGWITSKHKSDDVEIDRFRQFYKSALGITLFHPMFIEIQNYIRSNNLTSPCFFSGQNMEEPYMIQCVLPRGVIDTFGYLWLSIKNNLFLKQSLFGRFGHKLLSKNKFNSMNIGKIGTYKKYCFNFNTYDYMLFCTMPTKGYSIPFEDIYFLPDELHTIMDEFYEFKKNRFLEYAIDQFASFSRLRGYKNVDDKAINSLAKILLYLKYDQNAQLNYWNTGEALEYNIMLPASEGPMLDFFLGYQLSFKDYFLPKRYCYKYFQENFGTGFKSFVHEAISKGSYKESPLKKKIFDENRNVLHLFNSLINANDSIILENIENGIIRKYIMGQYKKLETQEGQKMSKHDIMELERLVNLEICLRHIFREKELN